MPAVTARNLWRKISQVIFRYNMDQRIRIKTLGCDTQLPSPTRAVKQGLPAALVWLAPIGRLNIAVCPPLRRSSSAVAGTFYCSSGNAPRVAFCAHVRIFLDFVACARIERADATKSICLVPDSEKPRFQNLALTEAPS